MMAASRDRLAVRLSAWAYGHCLRAYPAPFRRAYGREMVQVFRAACRDAYTRTGLWGVLLLWLPFLGDLIMNALAERGALRQSRRAGAGWGKGAWSRSLWAGWICAGALSWGAASLISRLLNGIPFISSLLNGVPFHFAGPPAWSLRSTGMIDLAVQGAVLAVAQWLVARRYLRNAGWLAWATVGATMFMVVLLGFVVRGEVYAQIWTLEWLTLSAGAVLGLAQWVVLRTGVRPAGWWIAVNTLGWPAGVIAAWLVYAPVARMAGPVAVGTVWFTLLSALGATLGGALYGAALGRVLISLLGRSPRPTIELT